MHFFCAKKSVKNFFHGDAVSNKKLFFIKFFSCNKKIKINGGFFMDFFNSAVDVLQTLVIALGAGLCLWGGINLLEGYGQDNPASKSQGVKQLVAGGGVALIGMLLVPLLSGTLG